MGGIEREGCLESGVYMHLCIETDGGVKIKLEWMKGMKERSELVGRLEGMRAKRTRRERGEREERGV
jgi:hypothetical protein